MWERGGPPALFYVHPVQFTFDSLGELLALLSESPMDREALHQTMAFRNLTTIPC
jgi:hypothetical protein